MTKVVAMVRVLLVEDEALIRLILADELKDRGYLVVEAANGEQALTVAAEHAPFDILLTDVQMPGAIDGIALAKLLRRDRPDLPVIFVTGRPEALLGVGLMGVHDAVMRKPFAASELVALVERKLQGDRKR